MKFVSIDVETTGLDSEKHQILQLAAVIVDTKESSDKWATFNEIVYPTNGQLVGDIFALNMNKDLIEKILKSDKREVVKVEDLYFRFYRFLIHNLYTGMESNTVFAKIKITPAGKNFSNLDSKFIQKLPEFDKGLIQFSHRTLDPGSMYVTEDDVEVPNLEQCKVRSGLFEDNSVSHDALDDAMDVAILVNHFLKNNEKR